MFLELENWKNLRKEWVKARDKAKPAVTKGAVKGVSIGDAIDGVAKASEKSYLALDKEVKSLRKGIKTYKDGMKAKHKDLIAWLEKNVEKPAEEIAAGIINDVGIMESIRQTMHDFYDRKAFNFPDGTEFHQAGMQAEKENKPWQIAAGNLFDRLRKSLALWKKLGEEIKQSAKSLKLDLPGMKYRAEILNMAKAVEDEANLVLELCKTKSLEEFQRKAKGCRDSLMSLYLSAKAIEATAKKLVP
jgi:hypothetical protein